MPHSLHSPFPAALRLRRFKETGKHNEMFLAAKFGSVSEDPGRVVNGDPEYVLRPSINLC